MYWDIGIAGAVLGCIGIASSFVGVLYLAPKSIRSLDRDSPEHIKARLLLSSSVCVGVPLALYLTGDNSKLEIGFTEWLGLHSEGFLKAAVLPLALFVSLFAGHLTHLLFAFNKYHNDVEFKMEKLTINGINELLESFFPNCPNTFHAKLRNLIVAPFTEEFAFRSCMAPLLLCGGFSTTKTILIGPLFFGIAHLHHAINYVKQGESVRKAAMVAGFQTLYTSLFGSLEMFVFLRTGHFISIALIHSWCNLLGLPNLEFMKKGGLNYERRHTLLATYLVGIGMFFLGLYPLTSPSLYGNKLWNFQAQQQ